MLPWRSKQQDQGEPKQNGAGFSPTDAVVFVGLEYNGGRYMNKYSDRYSENGRINPGHVFDLRAYQQVAYQQPQRRGQGINAYVQRHAAAGGDEVVQQGSEGDGFGQFVDHYAEKQGVAVVVLAGGEEFVACKGQPFDDRVQKKAQVYSERKAVRFVAVVVNVSVLNAARVIIENDLEQKSEQYEVP